MLKGIPKCISPALLRVLAEMGHGDEIVLADANFPAEALGKRVIRADGIGGCALLSAVLQLIPLDRYAEANFFLMQTTQGDAAPPIWKEYTALAAADENFRAGCLERYAFY